MGVVDFDPEKWSQANDSEPSAVVAKVAILAKFGVDEPQLSQLSQLSQVPPLPVPHAVRDGIAVLGSINPDRRVRADRWPVVVADAVRLAREGWAQKALALGWSPLDVFGAVTDAVGDSYSDGLAVWLNGRKLVAITATCATVEDGGGRHFYNRREQVGATLIWEISR